ncbi:MAG: type I DNA topoisomerase [Candidatus Eisenbacteria sp.]|nr:type I DNA topoisomerase [Candidatus Eisenbacteria bacterium]
MAKRQLVIVESPAKARTIERFLGKGFQVKASMGHVRDLPKNPKKKGDPDWIGIDEEHDFAPQYIILRDKRKVIDEILQAARGSTGIFLAADPDREGEAICWHLEQILRGKKIDLPIERVLFHEITRGAVRSALDAPRAISAEKVDAQQARRILDRIVGYRISPLLWDKVRRGLSAGRVQTVALRMIVEREREIRAFEAVEYWTVTARLRAGEGEPFEAKLISWRGTGVPWKKESEKGRNPGLPDEAAAAEVVEALRQATFTVAEVEAKHSRRSPAPPFTTSKLQQEAARRFHLPVRQTMRLAQSLYEGKDLGELGQVGLITYMRTDSVRVAGEAQEAARRLITQLHGERFVPAKPRHFRQKKSAQDAHEAIRPTSLDLPPEKLAGHLSAAELKLYTLIWNRFLASQMAAAEFDITRVEIAAGEARLRATGQVLRFAGWRQIYQEVREDDAAGNSSGTGGTAGDTDLPPLQEGGGLTAERIRPEQNETQPPPRYSEASLVRALEENGIGRPSTYAAILSVISDKSYVAKDEGRFHPTRLGETVLDLLVQHFGDIFAIAYTARLEEELDKIEEGSKAGLATLRDFAAKFRDDLEKAREEMENVKLRQEPTDFTCELCGSPMVKRWGRFGEFLACSRYPECRQTRDLDEKDQPAPAVDESCPKCGRPMTLRRGRWGMFLACTGYPECKTTRRIKIEDGAVEVRHDVLLDEQCPECGQRLARKSGRYGDYVGCSSYPECRYIKREETGVACPVKDCAGQLVEKRTRGRRRFYGCSRYPECRYAVWDPPVARACPECKFPLMVERETKRDGPHYACPECKAKVPRDAEKTVDDKPAS